MNEAPTNLSLSSNTVAENAVGATIGTITVAEPDAPDSHAFVVSDDRFELVAGQLKLKPDQLLDFETEPILTVSITARDAGGLEFARSFTLSVINVSDVTTCLETVGKGQRLVITGDELDNDVTVHFGAVGKGTVQIRTSNGTMLDGQLFPRDFAGINQGIVVEMLGGDDVLIVMSTLKAGAVSLDGGAGDDTYIIDSKSTKFTLKDSDGLDTIEFSTQLKKGAKVDLDKGSNKRQGLGNANSTTLDGVWENVIGTQFKDTFKGNAAANRFVGNGGNDTLDGREGDDILLGGAGKDKLTGGLGNDSLAGGADNDTLKATDGFAVLLGGDGKDKLTSGKGGNSLLMGNQTDTVETDAALLAILGEWTSGAALATRVGNFQTGILPSGVRLSPDAPATVTEDNDKDTIKTSGIDNHFLLGVGDKRTGK